jgi:predicted nucleic acid-binding protein
MIAADTSTWIAFFEGEGREDAQFLDKALGDRQVLMVPAVLTELLSDPKLPVNVADSHSEIPILGIEVSYWRRARLGDALIALSCADHGIPLLTRNHDFRGFLETVGLNLVIE